VASVSDSPHFRATQRQPVSVRVRFRKDEPASMLEHVGTMSDVGVGGAFVATDAQMPVGARIVLTVASPTAWEPLEVRATIRWVSPGGGEPAGFGVRFEALSGREATALYELVHASAYSEPDLE
jgi:uncharacterized protein (TIGR02266 family)